MAQPRTAAPPAPKPAAKPAPVSEKTPAAQPRENSGIRRRVFLAATALTAVILGVMQHLRLGYSAGDRDHFVLTPVGLRWANPDWFKGDWAVEQAPQPHWFFDILVWAGAETHTLAGVLFAYWVIALLVNAGAITLLAARWAPDRFWLISIAVAVITSFAPLYLLGSGAALVPTAVPGVLSGALVYLTAAALMTNHWRTAAAASVACAFVHVQNGTVTFVLLVLVAAASWWRDRQFNKPLLIGAGVTAVGVFIGLRVRPVAGHIGDFVEACNELIPYHCSASTWADKVLTGGVSTVLLALLTILYAKRGERWKWIALGAGALGLLAGVLVDRMNIPILGELAQGLNVYRLAVLVQPFAVWGLLTPLLIKTATRRERWLLAGLVGMLAYATVDFGWSFPVEHMRGAMLLTVIMGGVGIAIVTWRRKLVSTIAIALVLATMIGGAFYNKQLKLTTVRFAVYPTAGDLAWGDEVRNVVEPGQTLLVPPSSIEMRVATRRPVVVECKYGPYGGDPWREYKDRIAKLGGWEQCQATDRIGIYRVPAARLVEVADSYGADFIVVHARQHRIITGLALQGWRPVVAANHSMHYIVMAAPRSQ